MILTKQYHINPINSVMKASTLVCCLLFIAVYATGNAQTLDDYLVMAADSNAALKAKFLAYQAALEQVPQMGLPDPEISFGYFISPVETRVGAQEARFSAMQMFPWFGTLGVKKDMKTEAAKASYASFEQTKSDLFYQVKAAYYSLYESEQRIRIMEENLEILKTFESLATTRFESGTAGMVDVLRIQMEIAELDNRLLFWRDKRVLLTTAFNQQLNRDPDSGVVMPDTLEVIELLADKSILADSILAQNDRLASFEHMKLAHEYSIKAAKKMGAPAFGLGVNYVLVSERTDLPAGQAAMLTPANGQDALMPVMSIKIPLYRGKYKAQVKEAGLNLEAMESLEDEQRNELQTNLERAWVAHSDAGRRIKLYREQIKVAGQARQILIKAYSADGKDFEEILRVQRMLLNYELEIIKAVKDKNTAVAKIKSLM